MNEKQPYRLLREGKFTMLPPMEPTYFIDGVESWPVADRSAEEAAGPPVPGWVRAGEPVPPPAAADG